MGSSIYSWRSQEYREGIIGEVRDMEMKLEKKFQEGMREPSAMSGPIRELRSDH